MVNRASIFNQNGLRDWIIQRFTAVILGFYVFFIFGFFLLHPGLDYVDWCHFFDISFVRYFTLAALLALILHAWSGVWRIASDYIKCPYMRLSFYGLTLFLLIIYFFWGLDIIFKWSMPIW